MYLYRYLYPYIYIFRKHARLCATKALRPLRTVYSQAANRYVSIYVNIYIYICFANTPVSGLTRVHTNCFDVPPGDVLPTGSSLSLLLCCSAERAIPGPRWGRSHARHGWVIYHLNNEHLLLQTSTSSLDDRMLGIVALLFWII